MIGRELNWYRNRKKRMRDLVFRDTLEAPVLPEEKEGFLLE